MSGKSFEKLNMVYFRGGMVETHRVVSSSNLTQIVTQTKSPLSIKLEKYVNQGGLHPFDEEDIQ